MDNIRCTPATLSGEITAKDNNISYIYLLCAGALSEKGITVKGINADETGKRILDILRHMGAEVKTDDETISVRKNRLFGTIVNTGDMPDVFPLLSVMAGLCDKMFTQISGVRSVRKTDEDKVMLIAENLTKIGIAVSEDDDDEVIVWADNILTGGSVDAHNDPFFAMALMIASCACSIPLDIYEISGLTESYPDFIDCFNSLGGKAEQLD